MKRRTGTIYEEGTQENSPSINLSQDMAFDDYY